MSDNDFDAELLALAGDDSASEFETLKQEAKHSKSPTPESSPTSAPAKARLGRATKGVTQRRPAKPARVISSRRRAKEESDQDDEASSPESLGSGAMSESEEEEGESPPLVAAAANDTPLFPVEGKFYSEWDRAEIMAMPELQREAILADRAAEIERKKQSATLLSLRDQRLVADARATELLKKRKAGTADLDESPRKISRAKVKANENLENYKRKREQRNEQRRRNDDVRKSGADELLNENGLSDVDAEGDSELEWDEQPMKVAHKDEPPPNLREFERVRVGRTNFAKVCFYPGFEDSIKGCFSRVNVGVDKATGQNVYRMAQIKGFTTGRTYGMEGSNGRPFHTDQYVVLLQGKSEKEWPFVACSDSKITDAEFERWKQAMNGDSVRLPQLSFLSMKCDDIQNLLNHRWTAEEIEEKLRRSGVLEMQNATQRRERLSKEREKAITTGDESMIARLDQELASLEGPRLAFSASASNAGLKIIPPANKGLSQQARLAEINRANRRANQEEIRKAQLAEKKRHQEELAASARGEVVANRFARVKTRAKTNFAVGNNSLKVPTVSTIDELFADGSDVSRAGTPGVSTPSKKAGNPSLSAGLGGIGKKKIKEDDIIASMDLGIDIDI